MTTPLRMLVGLMLTLMALTAHARIPDIGMHDLAGNPRNVSEFIGRGKWTIVVIWAHDCLICDREIHQMAAFHNDRHARDAIVLGVSIDGADKIERARSFTAKHALPFVNLVAEPEEAVIGKFGGGSFVGTPTHFFFDPKGRIVGRKIGPLPRADLEEFIDAFNNSRHAR